MPVRRASPSLHCSPRASAQFSNSYFSVTADRQRAAGPSSAGHRAFHDHPGRLAQVLADHYGTTASPANQAD
jgi:hypothetical protein